MSRALNTDYMLPLTPVFPPERKGPTGDVPKLNCATCHQGAYKPMFGASMTADHAWLVGGGVQVKPAPQAPAAAAPTSAPAASGGMEPATVFFGVGSAALDTDAAKTLAPLVDGLKANAAAKVAISGFHSASGDLAANQELAKRRAFSVLGALTAAGIPEDRMTLEKPALTEANLAGEDPRSRRVDVAIR
jgi:photosynthetic reaction center cytochrome c subunit